MEIIPLRPSAHGIPQVIRQLPTTRRAIFRANEPSQRDSSNTARVSRPKVERPIEMED